MSDVRISVGRRRVIIAIDGRQRALTRAQFRALAGGYMARGIATVPAVADREYGISVMDAAHAVRCAVVALSEQRDVQPIKVIAHGEMHDNELRAALLLALHDMDTREEIAA